MPKQLKPLWLPQLVEARKSEEELHKGCDADNAPDLSASCQTSRSTTSELPSPVTPTFASAGSARISQSASSEDESRLSGSFRSNASNSVGDRSDSFHATGRFLPGVREEPSDRDEDYDMMADPQSLYSCCKSSTFRATGRRLLDTHSLTSPPC